MPVGKFRQIRSLKLTGTLLRLVHFDDFDMLVRSIHTLKNTQKR